MYGMSLTVPGPATLKVRNSSIGIGFRYVTVIPAKPKGAGPGPIVLGLHFPAMDPGSPFGRSG